MGAEHQAAGEPDSGPWPALVLIILLGAFLRLFRLGDQLILDDEWHALNVVQDHGYGWIFSHLGHADHSIPLALLYEFFSRTTGLAELSMRLPSALAGILALLILPRLWRPWLKGRESLVFTALLAISPMLINYSRIARPYALLALLAGASIFLAWRWWQEKDRGAGIAWLVCTVLAAWLNPVSLSISAGPFLWFAPEALQKVRQGRDMQPLLRLVIMGAGMLACITALLFTPFSNDFASLAVKSGVHQVKPSTILVAASLFAGSGNSFIVAVMILAAAVGWHVLYRRDRSFGFYILLLSIAATLAVTMTAAEWINQGLVLARYLIGLLPVFLALAAIGLMRACSALAAASKRQVSLVEFMIPLALLLLFLSGPLPHARAGINQFMHHMALQFDYDFERNPIVAALEPVKVEPFYREIAAEHPDGDALVLEAPWYLESNWNALSKYQSIHGQRVMVAFVGDVCAGRLYGELRGDIDGLDFRNFAALRDVLDGRVEGDYLVLRRQAPPLARVIAMDYTECELALRDRFGAPWRVTGSALVFRISRASLPTTSPTG